MILEGRTAMTTELTRRDDWARLTDLVTDSVTSQASKRAYRAALGDFLEWYRLESRPGFTKAVVNAYRAALVERGLAPSSINVRLSAIRKLAAEAADNGLMAPELAAGVGRVKGVKRLGMRIGNWLTARQAERLVNAPNVVTLKGKRDRAILALMIGAGLRRREVASLTVDHVQQREGRWVLVDIIGKGNRVRSVPIPSWAKVAIDSWLEAAGITAGRLLRGVNKGDRLVGESLDPQGVFRVVNDYATKLGFRVAPHDLRRTYAKLAHQGRAALEQIQLSLGHASIQTTERYLGIRQDLHDAPCDHLGLKLASGDELAIGCD
jgi:site-specific recombinase XerD